MLRRLMRALATCVLKKDLDTLAKTIEDLRAGEQARQAAHTRAAELEHRVDMTRDDVGAELNKAMHNGYHQGLAHGQLIGRDEAFAHVMEHVNARNGIEVVAADVERARKGLVH